MALLPPQKAAFVCLFVCLFVGLFVSSITQKPIYGQISMKFSGNVGNGMRKNWLNCVADPDSSLDPGIF